MTEASGESDVDLSKIAGLLVEAGVVVVVAAGLADVRNVLVGAMLVLLMLLGVVVVLVVLEVVG